MEVRIKAIGEIFKNVQLGGNTNNGPGKKTGANNNKANR